MIKKLDGKLEGRGYLFTDSDNKNHALIFGSLYKYAKKDGTETEYELLSVSNVNASEEKREEYPILVTYKDTTTMEIWTKPVEKFIKGLGDTIALGRSLKYEPILDITFSRIESLTGGLYLNWSSKELGFGQFSLGFDKNGKPVLNTECLGKEFAKSILCHIVDISEIED